MFKTFAFATRLALCEIALYSLSSLIIVPKVIAGNQGLALKSCPQDIAELTTLFLKDIPNYSNRVIQRTQDIHKKVGIDNYVIVAGQPELEPLELPQINYGETDSETTKQIFFTTLERQYSETPRQSRNRKKIERQTFHWLFVTMTDSGWHLVTMYSRFGHATKNTPPTPPQESSDGIIGQAASLWLRDCRESVTFH